MDSLPAKPGPRYEVQCQKKKAQSRQQRGKSRIPMISISNHTIRKHILSKIDNLGIFETQFSQKLRILPSKKSPQAHETQQSPPPTHPPQNQPNAWKSSLTPVKSPLKRPILSPHKPVRRNSTTPSAVPPDPPITGPQPAAKPFDNAPHRQGYNSPCYSFQNTAQTLHPLVSHLDQTTARHLPQPLPLQHRHP